jgi:ribosomal RNA assembly protein
MAEYLKIPEDRVGVLVGTKGEMKRLIEEKAGVKLDITHEGAVSIASAEGDGFKEWKAVDVVKAISRGFNPKYALQLLGEDYVLTVINLYDLFHGRESDIARVKARIIGEEGKAWKTIERLTNTRMSVYGRTVAVIGTEEDAELAGKALNMLIDGARHATVYRFLESARKEGRMGL